MTPGWTDWETFSDSAYVNWGQQTGGLSSRLHDAPVVQSSSADQHVSRAATSLSWQDLASVSTAPDLDQTYGALLKMALARLRADISQLPPFPQDAVNAGPDTAGGLQHYFDLAAQNGTIPAALTGDTLDEAFHLGEDSAITGVIDLGVPLGQQRTRMADQSNTRILAGWQQSASRVGLAPTDQAYLPFGQEYLAPEINTLIAAHTSAGGFDEEAFNRASGVEDYQRPLGQRELGLRVSHGAHILDCAAGMDATASADHADAAARRRIIAVNLPARELVGHAAEHLEFFAVFALLRIATLADAIWAANKRHGHVQGDAGYAIVVNLSFGKQAGARDGMDLIADVLSKMNAARKQVGYRPIFLSMPAGNENLERGNVRVTLQSGAIKQFNWRIQPEDQSTNFLEIWAEDTQEAGKPQALEIEVETPGGTYTAGFSEGTSGQARSLIDAHGNVIARLYAIGRSGDTERAAYMLATCWTLLYGTAKGVAPAGLWHVRLRNKGAQPLQIVASTQTDQTEKPYSVTNQRSYFDHAEYDRFNAAGRVIDSYSYPLDGTPPEPEDSSNLIRRHGTLTAIGRSKHTLLVAGYRSSDGRMASYSSTGLAGAAGATPQPNVALPSRTSAALYGQIAASGRDGGGAALEGTSVSAALLTRRFSDFLLSQPAIDPDQAISVFQQIAPAEDTAASYPGRVAAAKAGHGRMTTTDQNEDLGRFDRGIMMRTEA